MALDGEGVARVALQPADLLVEGRGRGRGQVGRVGLEEDAVADIDDEVLGAAGRRGTAGAEAAAIGGVWSLAQALRASEAAMAKAKRMARPLKAKLASMR